MKINNCFDCDLCRYRTNMVYGAGNIDSGVFFIGEAPGYTEDKTGIIFSGKSGKLLRSYMATYGFNESNCYITNVVKCRPEGNRDPMYNEIDACSKYLELEFKHNPKIVVTLGSVATKYITGMNKGITQVRGNSTKIGNKIVLPTFHPAAILRNKSLSIFYDSDFEKLVKLCKTYINPLNYGRNKR